MTIKRGRYAMRIDVLTTFPELFAVHSPAVLGVSIPARAIASGRISVHATNIRGFAKGKHQKTDDRPFGGGPGMVMMCQPVWDAVQHVEKIDAGVRARRVLLTPQGRLLTQELVEELSREPRLLLIAGHYEGIDERVIEALEPIEVSIGDYVLSGGEVAALVLIDAIARLQPGVLGDAQSSAQDSFSLVELPKARKTRRAGEKAAREDQAPATAAIASDAHAISPTVTHARLLDCPHYTKPREWMGRSVPEVLLSGDHGAIATWRLEQRMKRTRERRPDLLARSRYGPQQS